jgi:hypothetical protein
MEPIAGARDLEADVGPILDSVRDRVEHRRIKTIALKDQDYCRIGPLLQSFLIARPELSDPGCQGGARRISVSVRA